MSSFSPKSDPSVPFNLRQLRRASGLSAKSLAHSLQVSPATYYRYESGQSVLPSSKLHSLCRLLGCQPSDLLGSPSIPSIEDAASDPSTADVFPEDDLDGLDLEELLKLLRERTEMRLLFSLAKNATTHDVLRAVRIITALRKEDEGL